MQEPEPLRDLRVFDHAAADERDLAIELRREVDDDLQPIQARRKGGDDDLAFGAGEDLLERVFDLRFGAGVATAVDVRAVAEHRQHAFRPELGEPVQIERLAVERRLIDLEVAGVQQHALRRAHHHRHAVGHTVRHAHELDGERPNRDHRAGLHLDGLRFELVFLEFVGHERERERRAVQSAVQVRQHVGHAANVIFMRVREHECL